MPNKIIYTIEAISRRHKPARIQEICKLSFSIPRERIDSAKRYRLDWTMASRAENTIKFWTRVLIAGNYVGVKPAGEHRADCRPIDFLLCDRQQSPYLRIMCMLCKQEPSVPGPFARRILPKEQALRERV